MCFDEMDQVLNQKVYFCESVLLPLLLIVITQTAVPVFVEFTLSSEDSSTAIGFILDDWTGICQASSGVNERIIQFESILPWEGALSVYCMCNLSLSIT